MPEGKNEKYNLLFRRYCQGDSRAFIVLYEHYKTAIYGYIRRSVGDEDASDELFQDVWLKVISRSASYHEKGQFRSWLFTCAHNVIVDHFRRSGLRGSEQLVELDGASNENYTLLDIRGRIDRALQLLPFDQRQAFYLREELSCSVKEIARMQECSIEAAKSRLRYAYQKLKDQLVDLI